MAQLRLKQLDSVLTGSLKVSGSLDVTGSLSASSLDVAGNARFDEYIYHREDVDTFIRLQPDEINIEAGGENMIFIVEGGGGDQADKVTINNALADVDFQVKGDNEANLIRTDAANDRVGIGTSVPTQILTVAGNISASGDLSLAGGNLDFTQLNGTQFGLNNLSSLGYGFTISSGSASTQAIAQFSSSNGNAFLGIGKPVLFSSIPEALTVEGNISSSGYIYGDGSNLTGITSGIFQTTGSVESATANLQLSGSLLISGSTLTVRTGTDSGPPTASTAIYTNNITNGYPTSNAWGESLDGSYFNNFDNTTHVSEILRFMAGIISHSIDTASPTANTKTFGSLDTNENSLSGTDSIEGYLPTNYTGLSNATLDYLVLKDWTGVGETIFSGISVYHDNGPTYYIDFDSNSAGSTTVRSSADTELFGLGGLTSGAETEFKVRVHATQSFSDTGSVAAPDESSNTFTTQSYIDYSATSFGTTNGLELAKIASANPAVIPAAFQDGKFENVGGTAMTGSLSRKYGASATDFTSVSSSGYYRFHGLVVGMATGSGLYQEVNGTTTNRFWAPRDTIDTAIGDNSIDDTGTQFKYLTAVSRSLSGVPYITGSTYEYSTKITGLFNPMYVASTTLVDMTAASVGFGTATISGDTISTSGGTVQTSGKLFQSDGTTAVDSGVPRYNDLAIVTASVVWDADNDDNISQTGLGDSSFTVATKVRDRKNSQSTIVTKTLKYHLAGEFGQTSASGSLALYGRAQGYDSNTLQDTTETFTGESFRIQLLDNVQAFNGTAWVTTYELDQLGNYDLQVKPGYLVDPGGDYRYWYPASYGSGTYKYYIRRFQTDGSTMTSMTVNLNNNTLIAWNATTNGVSCAILFESSGNGSGNNASLGTARIYDPTATTSNLIEADMAADNFKNPLTTAISLYGNSGGSISTGTYTVPIRNADGMYLDSNDNELYIIVRYKGDPTPLDDITLTFS